MHRRVLPRLIATCIVVCALIVATPAPARAATTGELYPATASNQQSTGNTNWDTWTTPGNLSADDASFATWAYASGHVVWGAFPLAAALAGLPRNATVTDINVEVTAKLTAGSSPVELVATVYGGNVDPDQSTSWGIKGSAAHATDLPTNGSEVTNTSDTPSDTEKWTGAYWTTDSNTDVTAAELKAGWVGVYMVEPTGSPSVAVDYVSVDVTYTDPSAPSEQSTPYARLGVESGNVFYAEAINDNASSTSWIADMADWYVHAHGEHGNTFVFSDDYTNDTSGDSLAENLNQDTASIRVSNYRNGSYTAQGDTSEAPDLETDAPLGIAVTRHSSTALKLNEGLDSTETGIDLKFTANTWAQVPVLASSLTVGADTHSIDTGDYISWIRVGNEIMAVSSIDTVNDAAGTATITVTRDYWGTSATTHSNSTNVYTPLYVGNNDASANTGYPEAQDGGADLPLRYVVQVDSDETNGALYDGSGWIASTASAEVATTDGQGLDSIWLDVSSCQQYNQEDALSQTRVAWDVTAATAYSSTNWRDAQYDKFDELGGGDLDSSVRDTIYANNFAPQNGGGTNTCKAEMIADGRIEGYVLENIFNTDEHWDDQADQLMGDLYNNRKVVLWPKTYDGDTYGEADTRDDLLRLTYGTLLLGLRNGGSTNYEMLYRWMDCNVDTCGWPNAAVPEVGEDDEYAGKGLFFIDFGDPDTATVNDLTDVDATLACDGGNRTVYMRYYENGYVIVNPTDGSAITNCALPEPAYKIADNGTSSLVTTTSINDMSAEFFHFGT